MKVTSNYNCTSEENNYKSFECELNKNTLLLLELKGGNECSIKMEDKVSGVIDISATISNEDIKALIRTLRTISVEMDKINAEEKGGK